MEKFQKRTKSAPKTKQEKKKKPATVNSTQQTKGEEISFTDWQNQMNSTWLTTLQPWIQKGNLQRIFNWVSSQYASHTCRPISSEIFTAFRLTSFDNIKVVVVGQDPYPGPIQAMGLSFSVHRGVKVPGSLRNIYKCLQTDRDVTFRVPKHGDLTRWAQQGVFMLNAVLTVRQGQANSHAKRGWEAFTDEVIRLINKELSGVVFMLWGAFAQTKGSGVNKQKHLVLQACHPSPLAATKGGFFTCKHFSRANQYLSEQGKTPIDWNLD